MKNTDIWVDLAGEDIIDEKIDGVVYSPMMRKHLRNDEEDENVKRMKEDNFEIVRKQTDPDYEAIHFNRGRAGGVSGRNKQDETKMAKADSFDLIESASVLDFSSKKRELVLGIDRKPELKPLSAFKLENQIIQEKFGDHADDIDDSFITEDEESDLHSSENIVDDSNDFIREVPKKIVPSFNKTPLKKTIKISHEIKTESPLREICDDNNNLKINQTAALIKQFNKVESEESSPGKLPNKTKTTTKHLINKFNNSKSPFPTANKPSPVMNNSNKFSYNVPMPTNRTQIKKEKNDSKVKQMVSAFNKSGFPSNGQAT